MPTPTLDDRKNIWWDLIQIIPHINSLGNPKPDGQDWDFDWDVKIRKTGTLLSCNRMMRMFKEMYGKHPTFAVVPQGCGERYLELWVRNERPE